jgi:chromosomal replication initiator protein
MSAKRGHSGSEEELPLGFAGGLVTTPEQQAWEQICWRLKSRIGTPMMERWFSRAGVHELDGVRLVIRVPNAMHQYWIEDHFMASLLEVVADALGGAREIDFLVIADPAHEALAEYREAARSPERGAHVKKDKDGVTDSTAISFSGNETQLFKMLASSGLNSRFSFDSFVVGPNCSYSVAVAKAVAEKPGKTYNPLFLHGSVGLGKTHLMQAIGQEILRQKPRKVVRYVTSENFTSEYIEALRHHRVSDFRQKYRKVDVLLIDDVQFLAGKGSTQEEFFHTFNDLFNSLKQIVLTSDRAPSAIKNLEDRLVSRFEWGMATVIESPDLETRSAILRQKMTDWSVQVDDSVVTYLAEHIRTNVRRLEGALMRVAGHVSLVGGEALTRPALEALLRDIIEEADSQAISIDWIQKVVAEHFDIRLADMTSHRRPAQIAIPRQIAMHLARELTNSPLKEIGEAFGGRDHGTVIHACKSVAKKSSADDEFRRVVAGLVEKARRTT